MQENKERGDLNLAVLHLRFDDSSSEAREKRMQIDQLSPAALHHRPLTLSGLRGFEAAARLTSLTRAAQALNLTQSAISRQVQGLEEELGIALFVRKAREIVLTTEGAQFLKVVQRLLKELDASVEGMRRDAFSPRISVNTFASFASLWLIPRLAGFRALRPTADIEIGATDRLIDLELENVDIAIRYLRREAIPEGAELLIDEVLFPVVSPSYLKSAPPLKKLEDLAKHTLIESRAGGPAETRSTWPEFFREIGSPEIKGRSQLKFDFISQAYMAAQNGQGVALSRTYGADMFMTGELVRPIDASVATGAGCFLVVSERGKSRAEVRAFVEWLRVEVKTFTAQVNDWLQKRGATPKKRNRQA
jgi:LysR family transcriptional regulator, glycine cleavage system transcriptional activator